MIKKILIIICVFFLFGCESTNINNMTLEEIVNKQISLEPSNTTVNRKGYKYYLPQEFSVKEDDDYVQKLISNNNIYYLNIDIVSYYYKNNMDTIHELDDYEYYEFGDTDKSGYLRITKNNENFFVELCYNYAIIEVEVEESNLRYAISRAITILNSIKYNDLVIEKYITDNDVDTSETIYKIPEPKNKDNSKNILEYIESDLEDTDDNE
ncbi:MAG: hypothetical protein PUA90_00755 [bacterium]|nr:hypothetical protein [bacterium]